MDGADKEIVFQCDDFVPITLPGPGLHRRMIGDAYDYKTNRTHSAKFVDE